MENNKDNKIDSSDSKKQIEITVKRSKSKSKSTTTTTANVVESQLKRTFFGSRRKKKETATDSSSTSEQNVQKKKTETDSSVSKAPDYENEDSEDILKGALMVTEPHAPEYLMTHPRRGKAVIFNHEYFEKEDRREGTKIDVDRIKEVFGQLLKFDIEVHNDLDYVHIINQIERLKKEDYTNCDCIAIFVLSHGKKGGEISAKDMYYPADKLWEYFAGDKCVTLAGKPKLFFISACRGKKKDNGIRLFRGRIQADSSNKQITYKLPTQADFLIANSTVEGYYSYRDTHNGTWFIQCLCDVLTEHYETKDLMKMLTITSRKVAMDYRAQPDKPERPEDCEVTQIPSITTMLIRDVFFYKKE